MSSNNAPNDAMRRHALFVISVALTAGGLYFSMREQVEVEFFAAVCLKVGIVLFMLWLALPQLEKLNYWAIIPVALVAMIAVVRPQLIRVLAQIVLPFAPVIFLVWLFWIPKKQAKR